MVIPTKMVGKEEIGDRETWRGNFGLVSRNVTRMEWNADREVGYASSRSGFHKPGNNGWQNVPDTLYTFAYCGPFMRGIHNLTLALHWRFCIRQIRIMLAVEQLDCRMSVCLHDAVTLKSSSFIFLPSFFFLSFFFFLFWKFSSNNVSARYANFHYRWYYYTLRISRDGWSYSILYFTIFAAENINLVQLYFRSNFAISFSSCRI